MRRFIFASHHKLAYGLKDTVDFLTNYSQKIYDINAYISETEEGLEDVIKELFHKFDDTDEIIILTDIMGGSVYQKFFPYMNENVHIICGMNLPLAMSVVLAPQEERFTKVTLSEVIEESKNQIIYVNQMNSTIDSDDE